MLNLLLTTYVLLTYEINNIRITDIISYLKENNKFYTLIKRCSISFGLESESVDKTIIKLNYILMSKENINICNEVLETLKEQLSFNNNKRKSYELCQEVIITTEIERKQNAEVLTPIELVIEMISKIPENFWDKIESGFLPKIFDPCVGKGVFVAIIYDLLWEKLKKLIPDEEERRKTILEKIIYFADINSFNIYVTNLILNNGNKYKLNYYEGDTLTIDIKKEWDIDGFDLVIGNPPYQNSCGNKGKGNTLWDKFVNISLKKWLCKDGYLVFVHPQGWRQIDNKTGKLMLSKQILYLNMNDVNEGQKVFKCSTTFDYYVLQNTEPFQETIINDYKNKEYSFDLKNMRFISNHSILDINQYLDYKNENGIINDRSNYGADKKWMSKEKTEEFKYPCVYSINKKNELSLRYSNTNTKGHFDITKFIVSNGAGFYKDIEGHYGCTQWAYYIKCNIEDMDIIEKCFQNQEFLNIIDAVKLTSNKYNYSILKYLKKDFWKEFVDYESSSDESSSDESSSDEE